MRITMEDFERIDMRVGTVLTCQFFEKARKPAFRLTIDFGAQIGIKKSSAQITNYYDAQALIGKQIIAVVNLPPRQIADFMSEVLVLGVSDSIGQVALLCPDFPIVDGQRVH